MWLDYNWGMEIIRSRYAGACYGVKRALALVDEAASDSASAAAAPCAVYTLGPLIHNPQVVSGLRERGVQVANTVDDALGGTLVIRSHGVAPAVIEQAQHKGLLVIDATCPHVAKVQDAARQLSEQGFQVLIVGGVGHPEVESIRAYAGKDALVVQDCGDLPQTFSYRKIGVVVQSTQTEQNLAEVIAALEARGIEPVVHNTICFATRQRQEAARELAQEVDVMLVIGGRNSSNTTRLAQLCQAACERTYHIEQACELQPEWFEGARTVGVTAGASTPEEQITTVEQALAGML